MEISLRAQRLLAEIERSHGSLIEESNADDVASSAFRSIHEALTAGMAGLSDEQVIATPSAEEWSMAEVAEHVAEHDRTYIELERYGVGHYVEHGLEHALQLWRLRSMLVDGAQHFEG